MRYRLLCAWNILRGRPTGYRLTVRDGGFVMGANDHALFVGCVVFGPKVAYRVERSP